MSTTQILPQSDFSPASTLSDEATSSTSLLDSASASHRIQSDPEARSRRTRRRKRLDFLVTFLISAAFLLAVLPLFSLLWTVLHNGLEKFSPSFLTNTTAGMTLEGAMPGAGHAIIGTLEVTLSTAVMSIPLGVLTAIYLVEYANGILGRIITFLVDIMTGIPSIVAGLFAAAMLPVLLGDPAYRSGFMGSLALVVLMTPIVIRSS